MKVAYLTGQYPAVSHTFILREISALRDLGVEVLPCSVRQPPREHLVGSKEEKAHSETFYILQKAKEILPLVSAQYLAIKYPRRYWSAMKIALQLKNPGLKSLVFQLFYFVEATILARFLQKKNVTRIHNHFADSSANVAILAAELAGVKFSYTVHGPTEFFETNLWHIDLKTSYADFVVCISHFARSQVMLHSDPAHWDKLKIVHCGIEPDMYALDKKDKTDGEICVIFVGRLSSVKGVRILIEAFKIACSHSPNIRLKLVGDGEDKAHLTEILADWHESVTFTGYQSQEQVASHLAQADIMVLPSFAEGVPVVLMEAMASGKPVISSLLAGIPELIENGKNGYLVPPGSSQELSMRIIELAENHDLRECMGQAGRKTVMEEFNIGTEAARLASLFIEGRNANIRPIPIQKFREEKS